MPYTYALIFSVNNHLNCVIAFDMLQTSKQ